MNPECGKNGHRIITLIVGTLIVGTLIARTGLASETRPDAAPPRHFALYVGDGLTRGLTLSKQAASVDEVLTEAAQRRRHSKTVWILQGDGRPFPRILNPSDRSLVVEECIVYSRNCSRSPWLACKHCATVPEADDMVSQIRTREPYVEVVRRVRWQ